MSARSSRRVPIRIVVAVVVAAVILVAGAEGQRIWRFGRRSSGASTLVATLAYADALAPATYQAGRAIVLGIRPDIPDFRSEHISVAVWQTDMEARAAEFSAAWSGFTRVRTPSSLTRARAAFDRSFATYLLATRALWEAGTVTGADREALIRLGAALGDLGDRAFDQGAAVIQAARRKHGLGPDGRYPDKATGEASPG
jgi:hypothetical protein